MNKQWVTEWSDIMSKDEQYDSEFLMKIIMRKLNLMNSFYRAVKAGTVLYDTDANLDLVISSVVECISLGEKILNHNYGEQADAIFAQYGSTDWLYKNDQKYKEWDKLVAEAAADRSADIKKFFNLVADNMEMWSI